jgi:hypothetical protein
MHETRAPVTLRLQGACEASDGVCLRLLLHLFLRAIEVAAQPVPLLDLGQATVTGGAQGSS